MTDLEVKNIIEILNKMLIDVGKVNIGNTMPDYELTEEAESMCYKLAKVLGYMAKIDKP